MDGQIANIVVQLIAGAIGGTAAGTALKDLSLGKAGDAISGAVGGGIVGRAHFGGGAQLTERQRLRCPGSTSAPSSRTWSAAAWAAPW